MPDSVALLVAATLGVAFVSALLPFVNIEVYLIAAVALQGDQQVAWLLAVMAAVGQMVGKALYFAAGRGLVSAERLRRFKKDREPSALTRRSLDLMARHPWTQWLVCLTSASVGIPPFLVISVVMGATKMSWPSFIVCGLLGRTVRFGVLVASPLLFERWLG